MKLSELKKVLESILYMKVQQVSKNVIYMAFDLDGDTYEYSIEVGPLGVTSINTDDDLLSGKWLFLMNKKIKELKSTGPNVRVSEIVKYGSDIFTQILEHDDDINYSDVSKFYNRVENYISFLNKYLTRLKNIDTTGLEEDMAIKLNNEKSMVQALIDRSKAWLKEDLDMEDIKKKDEQISKIIEFVEEKQKENIEKEYELSKIIQSATYKSEDIRKYHSYDVPQIDIYIYKDGWIRVGNSLIDPKSQDGVNMMHWIKLGTPWIPPHIATIEGIPFQSDNIYDFVIHRLKSNH